MPNSGYPTPDNFDGDAEYICIPIIVPNKAEFKAAIYGLYSQMANDWFWRELGTMTPQQAAWLSSRGLALTDAYGTCGGTMDCEDVADCVEAQLIVNESLRNSIFNTTIANGFGNPNRINATGTKVADRNSVGALEEPIIELENCDLNALWSGIRHGIVDRLDDNARDMLEDLAAIPNVIERLAVFIDIVPVMGDVAEGVVFQITEVIPDLLDLYNSASSEAFLDGWACDLFSMVCSQCRFPTFTEITEYSLTHGLAGLPALPDATLETIAEFVLDAIGNPAAIAYHTIMFWQLMVLNFQATFAGASGTAAIQKYVRLGVDFSNDNWVDLCEACEEQYAVWTHDFTQGKGDWEITITSGVPQAVYEGGVMSSVLSGSNRVLQMELPNINPLASIIGARVEYEITNQSTTVMRWREYSGSNTNAANPSISNCTDLATGWRWSYQGTDIAPPSPAVTGKRAFWIALGATGAASIIKVHKVSIEYVMPIVPYPVTMTTDAEALWCP